MPSRVVDAFYGAIVFVFETLYATLFNISPLYTEGVWPLGRPIAPSATGPEIGFNGGLVAFAGDQAYDKVAPSQGGEILVFSLLIFFFAYVFGGYLQFFDWKIEGPERKRDPVNGFFLILLWFPLYYGFVGVVHAILLSVPINLQDIQSLIIGIFVSTGVNVGIGKIAAGIGVLGLLIIIFVMFIRPIVIGVYFLFGQVLIAVGWADVPKASDQAVNLLIKSIPVALVPLPLYGMMWVFSFVITGSDIMGFQLGGWFTAEAIVFGAGVYIFAGGVWATLWLMWLVFTRTGKYVEQAGQSIGKIGGTLGLVAAGRSDDAKRAARYGPESVIGREAFNKVSNRGDNNGESSNGSSENGNGFVSRVRGFWGGEDGSRK